MKGRVQSVIFEKRKFPVVKCQRWLREHGLTDNGYDETAGFYRFRQVEPDFDLYRTVTLAPGIKAVVGIRR